MKQTPNLNLNGNMDSRLGLKQIPTKAGPSRVRIASRALPKREGAFPRAQVTRRSAAVSSVTPVSSVTSRIPYLEYIRLIW